MSLNYVMFVSSNPCCLVEVSWSPPSDRVNIITGYRIFYGNGQQHVTKNSKSRESWVSFPVDRCCTLPRSNLCKFIMSVLVQSVTILQKVCHSSAH